MHLPAQVLQVWKEIALYDPTEQQHISLLFA